MDKARKRSEDDEILPADKRPCSSGGSDSVAGGSSSSSEQPPPPPPSSSGDHDMDRSNTHSGEDEYDDEDEGDYDGYTDEDGDDAAARRADERAKFERIVPAIQGDDAGGQLAALVELCEVLSLAMEDSLSAFPMDKAVPALVRLAGSEGCPEVMLLAARAITYLCDIEPGSADVIVRHGALPVLCSRLMAIEYLDLAEQCLQALEKISRRQPVPCLLAGSVLAALSYIDFFSTSIQRVALSVVSNICKKIPLENAALAMESVPILRSILLYDDPKLVQAAATCLIRMSECFSQSPALLDELCKHGLVNQALQLIAVDGRVALNHSTYLGLFGLLTKLAASSIVSVRTLFELNVSSTLKSILMASSDLSNGTAHHHLSEVSQSNKVNAVLKLVHKMIPQVTRDSQDADLVLAKEKILTEQPDLMLQFARDMLPIFVQVANQGASLSACYGCVSVMNSIFYLSAPDMLLDLVNDMNISSFLAGLLLRKNHHVQMLALKVVDVLMQKLHNVLLGTFLKEGVIYAIESLLIPEKCSMSNDHKLSHAHDSEYQTSATDVPECLCHAFYSIKSSSSEAQTCMLEKVAIVDLAKQLKSSYFSDSMVVDSSTGIFEKLKSYCAVLDNYVENSLTNRSPASDECCSTRILNQIMQELDGQETLSTFELVEGGLVRSLLHYLSDGRFTKGRPASNSSSPLVVQKRCQTFSAFFLQKVGEGWKGMLMTSLLGKFQNALSTFDNFPVILSHDFKLRNFYTDIPDKRATLFPCIRVHFVKEDCETNLLDYNGDLMVELSSSMDTVEKFLWPKVSPLNQESQKQNPGNVDLTKVGIASGINDGGEVCAPQDAVILQNLDQGKQHLSGATHVELPGTTLSTVDELEPQKMVFSSAGKDISRSSSIYQAILQRRMNAYSDLVIGPKFWNEVHEVKYRLSGEKDTHTSSMPGDTPNLSACDEGDYFWQKLPFLSNLLLAELPCQQFSQNPSAEILLMLKVLDGLNRFSFHILFHKRINAFAEGEIRSLVDLKVAAVSPIPQAEFVSCKLTDKILQQIRDPLVAMSGSMPSWCSQLMSVCPFLFSFEARWKYFLLITNYVTVVMEQVRHLVNNGAANDRLHLLASQRRKFKVNRDSILESASKMMASHARSKFPVEVEYFEEVGTGLGPTLEFYTFVSHEFQKVGLGMWRGDQNSQLRSDSGKSATTSGSVAAPYGLFPRPWPETELSSSGSHFSDVLKNFKLLGQVVAKAIKDGRIMDLSFSRAFYKLMLEQEPSIYDIQSFDPGLGWTLLEFQALIARKKRLESISTVASSDLSYRNVRIEDLCLDFSLPGYPDFVLFGSNSSTVNIDNLEAYISFVVDATVRSGVSRQMEAFRTGFDEVFPLKALQIFTEDEVEHLLCGERDAWQLSELLDHIKFDHGYTASSPPIISLLEIICEMDGDQRRAFLQFVTGAPRLPLGGLAALSPKMTIVRKQCNDADMDLPSVMTCVNYLKLPPYSSKDRMRVKLLYAITEGQGSFHLS